VLTKWSHSELLQEICASMLDKGRVCCIAVRETATN